MAEKMEISCKQHDMGKKSINLSKTLSWLLRHGAVNEGLSIGADGFANVEDILKHRSLQRFTENCIRKEVESNQKQRFTLKTCPDTGRLQIRANQGHSFQVTKLQLTPIFKATDAPVVIHGTNLQNWEKIQKEGLSRMNRIHIHFVEGEPGAREILSGYRSSSNVLIYLDIEKSLTDGIVFFRSSNNVILSPGDESGFIRPKYFKSVKFL